MPLTGMPISGLSAGSRSWWKTLSTLLHTSGTVSMSPSPLSCTSSVSSPARIVPCSIVPARFYSAGEHGSAARHAECRLNLDAEWQLGVRRVEGASRNGADRPDDLSSCGGERPLVELVAQLDESSLEGRLLFPRWQPSQ